MTHTTIEQFHTALAKTLKERVPEIKAVTAYERLPERAAVPLAMVEVTDILPAEDSGDIGTEQYAARVSFSIYLVGESKNEPAAKLAIRSLAARVSSRMNRQHIGVSGGFVEIKGAYFDFVDASGDNANGRNAASFVEVWRVDAECVIILGEDCWDWPKHEVTFVFAEGIPDPKPPVLDSSPASPPPVAPASHS